jgi:hypothetical protein
MKASLELAATWLRFTLVGGDAAGVRRGRTAGHRPNR